MEIKFSKTLRDRTIAFCEDELSWHISEAEPSEYYDETCAEIELLFLLGERSSAEHYKDWFLESFEDDIGDDKDLYNLRRRFQRFWKTLVTKNA